MTHDMLYADYVEDWIKTYKEGSVRPVSLAKYYNMHRHLKNIAPDVKLAELNKRVYQQIINKFALTHTKTTTSEFHNCIRAPLSDAADEGLLAADPTKRVVIKGKQHESKLMFLSSGEAEALAAALQLTTPIIRERESGVTVYTHETNWDWFIFLCLGTGIRASEALGVTPADFDFDNRILSINKTFDYKLTNGLVNETKSKSSKRHLTVDGYMALKFENALKGQDPNLPIFVPPGQRVHLSDPSKRLHSLCASCGIPKISIHALRHTHASVLLYNGVSVHAISRRLGHSKVSVTQDVYLHIIKELEEKDNNLIADTLEGLYGKVI